MLRKLTLSFSSFQFSSPSPPILLQNTYRLWLQQEYSMVYPFKLDWSKPHNHSTVFGNNFVSSSTSCLLVFIGNAGVKSDGHSKTHTFIGFCASEGNIHISHYYMSSSIKAIRDFHQIEYSWRISQVQLSSLWLVRTFRESIGPRLRLQCSGQRWFVATCKWIRA